MGGVGEVMSGRREEEKRKGKQEDE